MEKKIFIICLSLLFSRNKESKTTVVSENKQNSEVVSIEKPRVEINYNDYCKEAEEYCKTNKLNQNISVLIDLGEKI